MKRLITLFLIIALAGCNVIQAEDSPVGPTADSKPHVLVHFIDVGQGDSALIQTPEGANILIDGGIQSAGDKVVTYIKSQDVSELDLVVATHPHADHIGGLIPVLDAFPVAKFVDSGNAHTSQTYIDLLTSIDVKNIPFEVPEIGQAYIYSDFKMTILHVDSDASNANDASIVMKAEYGKVSFMFTGDAETGVENSLVNGKFNLNSTIYKAGHHGSNTSSTVDFIQAVNPSATILSYGEGNQYGHPHDQVVNRLQAIGSKIYSTADLGDITVSTDGVTYVVSDTSSNPAQLGSDPVRKPDLNSELEVLPEAPTSFQNCTDLRVYYPDGVRNGHPAYEKKHDRDNDGWACE